MFINLHNGENGLQLCVKKTRLHTCRRRYEIALFLRV